MANLTKQEIIEQIDYERRESNAKFISPDKTTKLMNRALNVILREPGVRTVPLYQDIVLTAGTGEYLLDGDFKEVISLWSGEGSTNGIRFDYRPADEFNSVVSGYVYTFNKKGYISIKVPDLNSMPSTTIRLRFWSKNILLASNGTTYKRVWDDDEDTSALDEEFDDFYIEWVVANILRREGKAEWKDRMAMAKEVLQLLKEAPASKTRRPKKAFGHYLGMNDTGNA